MFGESLQLDRRVLFCAVALTVLSILAATPSCDARPWSPRQRSVPFKHRFRALAITLANTPTDNSTNTPSRSESLSRDRTPDVTDSETLQNVSHSLSDTLSGSFPNVTISDNVTVSLSLRNTITLHTMSDSATLTESISLTNGTLVIPSFTFTGNISETESLNVTSSNYTFSGTAEHTASESVSVSTTLPFFPRSAYLTQEVLESAVLVSLPTFMGEWESWPGRVAFARDVFRLFRPRGFTYLEDQYANAAVYNMICMESNVSSALLDVSFATCFDYNCTMSQNLGFVCPVQGVLGCDCPTGPRYPPRSPQPFNASLYGIRTRRRFERLDGDGLLDDVRLNIQFVLRLEEVASFYPSSLSDIVAAYNAFYIAAQQAFLEPLFVAMYKIDVANIRVRRVRVRPTPAPTTPVPTPAPIIVPPKEPNLMYLLLLLLLLLPGLVWVVFRIFRYFQDRRYRARFQLWAGGDKDSDAEGVDDEIMMAGLTPRKIGDDARGAERWGAERDALEGAERFDPIADTLAEAECAVDVKPEKDKDVADESDDDAADDEFALDAGGRGAAGAGAGGGGGRGDFLATLETIGVTVAPDEDEYSDSEAESHAASDEAVEAFREVLDGTAFGEAEQPPTKASA